MNRNPILWLTPPAILGAAVPGYATTYLTVEQAEQAIFPGAELVPAPVEISEGQRQAIEKASGVRVRNRQQKVWKVEGGGWFIVDEVVGKHEFITYALGLNVDGSVKQIEIMEYRETYGGEIRGAGWRSQFVGKTSHAKLALDDDIKNISGATLSCRHVTDGVKRLLAFYDVVLK